MNKNERFLACLMIKLVGFWQKSDDFHVFFKQFPAFF
jgi:hypothetical protein